MDIAAIIIAGISLLVSIWAITVSKQANKLAETKFTRDKEIEKPILFNVHTNGADNFVFVIEDYSANKNLRIDKIEFTTSKGGDYKGIPFDIRRNDKINPSQVDVTTTDKFMVLDAFWFKIYTNQGEVLEHEHCSAFEEKNTDD